MSTDDRLTMLLWQQEEADRRRAVSDKHEDNYWTGAWDSDAEKALDALAKAESQASTLRQERDELQRSLTHWQHCHGVTADALVESEVQRAAKEAECTALRAALEQYGRHMADCRRCFCQSCLMLRREGHHEDSYNGDTSWHSFIPSPCSCGFDATLPLRRQDP